MLRKFQLVSMSERVTHFPRPAWMLVETTGTHQLKNHRKGGLLVGGGTGSISNHFPIHIAGAGKCAHPTYPG
jgi:hypothetical protein